MKQLFLLICTTFSIQLSAQNLDNYEKAPIFPNCQNEVVSNAHAHKNK